MTSDDTLALLDAHFPPVKSEHEKALRNGMAMIAANFVRLDHLGRGHEDRLRLIEYTYKMMQK